MSRRTIRILDTTLRDGALTPGVRFSSEAREEIALALERAGVEVIEAGFPARAEDEAVGVARVASVLSRAMACALCRASPAEIERAAALLGGRRGRIHVFAGGVGSRASEVIPKVEQAIALARASAHEVQFTPLDASRLERAYLLELASAAAQAGATLVSVSDTLGAALPEDVAEMVGAVRARVDATISFHGHDDLGLATACSLAAIAAGATQVEVCVNGLGPRAGNTALEQLAAALALHGARWDCESALDLAALRPLSALVARHAGVSVAPSRPIVGAQAGPGSLEALIG